MSATQPALPSASTAPNEPEPERAEDRVRDRARASAERAERQMMWLEELAEIGMVLAREIREQAVQPAEPADLGQELDTLGPDYARVAHAVRQTIALEKLIDKELLALEEKQAATEAERRTAEVEHRAFVQQGYQIRRRKIVQRAVRRAIDHAVALAEADADEIDEEDVENTYSAMYETLRDYEACGELKDRPFGEIIARICRDLGINPDLSLWQDEPWAVEEMRTKPKGSPYADRVPEVEGDGELDAVEPPFVAANGRGPPSTTFVIASARVRLRRPEQAIHVFVRAETMDCFAALASAVCPWVIRHQRIPP